MAARDRMQGDRTAAATGADQARRAAHTSRVCHLRALALVLVVALVVMGLVWEIAAAPTGRGWLALKVLPLVLAVPGLVRHRLYTARWLSLALWLYVLEGLARATSEPAPVALFAWAQTVLAVALFAALVVYVRARFAGASLRAGDRAAEVAS